jgi:glucokinase
MTDEIVAADIGGTHARFAITEVSAGRVVRLDPPVTLKTADYAGLPEAWQAFCASLDRRPPRIAAIALATTIAGPELQMTNNPWVICPALLNGELGLDRHLLMNDFVAIGHAVAHLGEHHFAPVCGPETGLPDCGVISVVGPGTGLGVAALLRTADHYHVLATEGGHVAYAARDAIDEAIVAHLSASYGRVSAERVVSGSGLQAICATLAALEGQAVRQLSDAELWRSALDGQDPIASAALDRFCESLGAVAGDIVLAQGGSALVIAGGLGLRLAERLGKTGFAEAFVDKGRFRDLMETRPVYLISHPQPGLYGAAAAFATELGS